MIQILIFLFLAFCTKAKLKFLQKVKRLMWNGLQLPKSICHLKKSINGRDLRTRITNKFRAFKKFKLKNLIFSIVLLKAKKSKFNAFAAVLLWIQ